MGPGLTEKQQLNSEKVAEHFHREVMDNLYHAGLYVGQRAGRNIIKYESMNHHSFTTTAKEFTVSSQNRLCKCIQHQETLLIPLWLKVQED